MSFGLGRWVGSGTCPRCESEVEGAGRFVLVVRKALADLDRLLRREIEGEEVVLAGPYH